MSFLGVMVYGANGCSACEMTKKILKEKNVEFSYELLEEVNQGIYDEVMEAAKKKGIRSMPIIIKDDVAVSISEVL